MAKKSFKFSLKLFIPIALVIFVLLAVLFFSRDYLLSETLQKSTANLKITGSTLSLNFNIVKKDKENAKEFSQKLNIGDSFEKGIEIELDQKSLDYLKNKAPDVIYLDFDDNEVNFISSPVYVLNNVLTEEKVNFSTGSSKLNFSKKRNGDFELNLKNPSDLIIYATSSGKIKLSEKLLPIFSILDKIDTMDITLQEKNIKGRVRI